MRDVRRIGRRHGLRGGPGKRVDGVFPGRTQSFPHQRRPVDDCSPGRGGMAHDGVSKGETFHGEMDRSLKTKPGLDYGMTCNISSSMLKVMNDGE